MSAELRAQLPATWRAFFAPHGSFTEVQQRAIPVLLAGWDALVVAATATGKTEAAIAPLLERHLYGDWPSTDLGLRIVYLCPTRALVRDLFERLRVPLAELGVPLMMKSGDTGPVSTRRPPAVLITTPESLDSLLTRAPRLLRGLRALVIDEIHLFDDGPRGDQLRCLLRRVARVRDYQSEGREPLHCVALSATVADPQRVARRYLTEPVVVEVGGGRELSAELYPIESFRDLARALNGRAAAKTLIFCNSRSEVEQVASYLRDHLSYEAAIFVHYSNLDAALRREVEARFAGASVAVCVSSSTLELGIDIGSIDEVALVGPPSTLGSFLQRIGRGGRRGRTTKVLCLPRSAREYLRFQALLSMAHQGARGAAQSAASYHFRPSVLVQQTFSLLKQSPTGGLRFADLRRVTPDEVADETLRRILGHLSSSGYLRAQRPGEWQPGVGLNDLTDNREIYGNIGNETLSATMVDAYSGRKLAQVERPRRKGETLLLGGRSVEVAWRDRYLFGVNSGQRAEELLRFRTAPQAVPLELAQGVAAQLGVVPGHLLTVPSGSGLWLFHFWGDIYGELLAALLRAQASAEDGSGEPEPPYISTWNELCLRLPDAPLTLPSWDARLAEAEVAALQAQLEPILELGRFHPLLPPDIARTSVLEQVDLPRLGALYRRAQLLSAPEQLRASLSALL